MANSAVTNAEIAAAMQQMAQLLEISGADFFRTRAYKRAHEVIAEHQESLAAAVERGEDLSKISGIGKTIAEKIGVMVETGSIPQLEELKESWPVSLIALTNIENLGPKRVGKLYTELGIKNSDDLAAAIKSGKLQQLEGFGEKLVAEIAADIDRAQVAEVRVQWAEAEPVALELLKFVRGIAGVQKAEVAGSFRRKRETVGDFDIVSVASDGPAVIEEFTQFSKIKSVQLKGDTRTTVILKSGMQVDLRVVPAESFGAAMQYFTGSKAHGIAVRKVAQSQGLKLNEYGLYKGEKQVAGATEEEIYETLGLAWVPPELREDRGEVQLAADDNLPELVTDADILGDFQCHTTGSDGTATLEKMVEAARAAGLKYCCITDHSKYVGITDGQDAAALRTQIAEIRTLQKKYDDFTIFASCEVDILKDGTLALEDDVLAELDFVIVAVHSHFKLSEKEQTARLVRALEHPRVHALAHPTGRIIGKRSGYAVDVAVIVAAAKKHDVALEINAHPSRLDLDDAQAKYAKEQGVKLFLATDAHSPEGFAVMRYGVQQARRVGLTKEDLLNTKTAAELQKYLKL